MHTTTKKRRRLKKKIRETVAVVLCAMAGAVILVSLLIGSAIQTQDRLNEMSMEVQP